MPKRVRRIWVWFGALVVAALVLGLVPSSARDAGAATSTKTANVRPFRGLGTWVDVYDYGPKFQSRTGALTAVTPA
jgi:hypothetical protein